MQRRGFLREEACVKRKAWRSSVVEVNLVRERISWLGEGRIYEKVQGRANDERTCFGFY